MSKTFAPQRAVFQNKGELATRIKQFDWASTAIGGADSWPRSLHQAIELLTNSAFPMFLLWGDELLCFYNDAFRPAMENDDIHTTRLAQPAKAVWSENWATIEPLINSVMEGQSTGLLEDQLIQVYRDGKLEDTYWTFSYNPLKNDNGQIGGVLGICLETTHKFKQALAADALRQQLSLALEACDLGTWDLDPTTMVFKCNEKTKEIFGLTGNSSIDLQRAVDVIEPEDRPRIKAAINKALDPNYGGYYKVSYTVIHPHSNDRRVVRAKGKVFFDGNRKPEKFTGTVQDITEESLSIDKNEKLQQLVENSIDFMSMATLEGKMTYMNAAGRKLIGLEATDDVSLLRIDDFYTDEQFKFVKDDVIPTMQKTGQWSGFVKIKHLKSGEEIPCHGNYILVKDPANGKVISRAATLRDLRPDLQARKELLDSEKRFRNLVQEAPVATAIYLGREMKIQWANDAMIKLWGKDKTVIGKTVREALPELEDQPFHELLDQVYTTGEMYQATEDEGELVVDGELQKFFFNFSYKPLRDANGEIYGILNMAIDVTEMVNNKRKLQESENAFRNLIMKAPVGICLLKGDEFIVDIANDQYADLVGRSYQELMNRPIWEVLPEAKAQGFDSLLSGVKTTGKAYFGNEQSVDLVRNGQLEKVYLNFVYEPLFDENGNVHSILVIAIEITQQVRLRQQIESAEKRARLAVASANLGSYELDLITGKVIASPRFNELFDFDQEAHHFDYVSKIHPADLHSREKAYQAAFVSGLIQYDCRICRRDGTENWVRINGQMNFDTKRQPNRIIGIVQDITLQKNIEQELENRVQERTAELKRLNSELQQFVFISSHDLKEPLRKIQVFGSLAKEQAEASNTKLGTSLDKVVHSASRMASLLNDLIQYSTLSDTNASVEKVDLNEILQSTLEDLEILITEKEGIVTTENLPTIEGKGFQLSRLFYNLVHNALKFSKPGQPSRIAVSSLSLSENEKLLNKLPTDVLFHKIVVTDNGIGFKPEFAEKMFVVFQRLQSNERYEGNGMGLAICKKVVDNHKGVIYASSEENGGSVFTVLLPESSFG